MAYRLPCPRKITLYNGVECKKDFHTICTDYDVQLKNMSVKNQQANGVLERVHLVICNMLQSKNLAKLEMPEDALGWPSSQVSRMPLLARTIQHYRPLLLN